MNAIRHEHTLGEVIAPLSRRGAAALIDFGAIAACTISVGILVAIIDSISSGAALVAWPIGLLAILGFAIWNFGLRQGGDAGGSLGKSAMNLSVVDTYSGEQIGRRKALLRFILRPIDFFFAIGLAHAVIDVENQTIVDRLLKTLVVHNDF